MLVPVPSVHADIQPSVRSLSPRVNVVVAETDLRSQTGEGTWVSGMLRSTRPASPRPQCRDPRTAALRSRARVERSTTESSLLPPLPLEHRSHRSIAPTRASLPLEHRSHWSTAPTGATGTARAMVRRVASADHLWSIAPRDGRPAFTVLAPHSLGVRSCVRMAWSLDKPARHRHAQESLSRPLPRSAAPSPATKSPISQYRKQSLRLLEPITTRER